MEGEVMKNTKIKKNVAVIALCAAVLSVSALSYGYSNTMPVKTDTFSEAYDDTAEISVLTSISDSTAGIDDYELYVDEFTVLQSNGKSNDSAQMSAVNKYGSFSVESNNGKVKKYKYGNYSASKKYLIKGTADFSKLDISFDGYFLVDETLSGNKKGQVIMYKGKIDLPNGDKFNGTLSSGKYYSSGTYTWKDGKSYKGKYTTKNKLGSSSLPENKTEEYGYFYFDKAKKNYLFIRFVNSVPRETGYYVSNGTKYTVVFDKNGTCISTKK